MMNFSGNNMIYSNHATKRMQQRGIHLRLVEMLLTFGSECSKYGASTVYLSKVDLVRIKGVVGYDIFKRLSEKPIYAVIKGNFVITVGHLYKRIHR